MGVALKKGALLLVLIFLVFYMFKDPTGMAAFAKEAFTTVWDALHSLFEALISFLNALFA